MSKYMIILPQLPNYVWQYEGVTPLNILQRILSDLFS